MIKKNRDKAAEDLIDSLLETNPQAQPSHADSLPDNPLEHSISSDEIKFDEALAVSETGIIPKSSDAAAPPAQLSREGSAEARPKPLSGAAASQAMAPPPLPPSPLNHKTTVGKIAAPPIPKLAVFVSGKKSVPAGPTEALESLVYEGQGIDGMPKSLPAAADEALKEGAVLSGLPSAVANEAPPSIPLAAAAAVSSGAPPAMTPAAPSEVQAPSPSGVEPGDSPDKTVRLVHKNPDRSQPKSDQTERVRARSGATAPPNTSTEIRYGAAVPPIRILNSQAVATSSAEAQLKQSESLRIAQSRITELESELERVRREDERLATAAETIRRRADELITRCENAETAAREQAKIFEEEKKVLRGQIHGKERELEEQRQKVEELESRLENGFRKIRVRERDLEHRLEIMKMESATLISTKDRMILDLKRQVDQLTAEAEYGKSKSQEMYNQYKEKQETIHRVVRALRIALMILEGSEDSKTPLKKAE